MEKNVDGVALATVKKILPPIDRSGYKVQILAVYEKHVERK